MNLNIIMPGNTTYDKWNSRGVNLRWKGHPSGIIPVATTDELKEALQYAVDNNKRVVVRGGGHCLENFVADPAVEMVIDISRMKGIRYDEEMNAIEVTAGSTLGEVLEALDRRWGILLPAGQHPAIGIGGHISGGAFGFLHRQHGLAVDYLYAVEILWVNNERQVEKAIATREENDPNRELWWAHTGGGTGNFGIVTRYWFRAAGVKERNPSLLLPASPEVLETMEMEWDWEQIDERVFKQLLDNFGEWSKTHSGADTEAGNLFATLYLLNKVTGKIMLKAVLSDCPEEIAEEFAATISANLGITGRAIRKPMRWLEFALQPFPDIFVEQRVAFKVKDALLRTPYTPAQTGIIYRYLTTHHDVPGGAVGVATFGGKMNAVAKDATAFPQRDSIMATACNVGWMDPADEAKSLAWARGLYQELFAETGGLPVPGGQAGGCLIAHPDADLADEQFNKSGVPWHVFYYQDNYKRLQRIKTKWDPLGIFRHALSVEGV
ncbi:FAD-binding oxidoreductase [Chitinophaga sp.]|uniref:FAD-binding oxidoreductase n=1 Tax=Chitinophaga sp. TaxID=1869181 RepID=UPI002F95D018